MLTIVLIILHPFIFPNSLVAGLVTENIAQNDQNNGFFSFQNLPAVGWLYDQVYASTVSDSNSKPIKPEFPSVENSDLEKIPKLILDVDESPDELESSKKVDDVLEIIEKSSDEEKKEYMPFLENLEKTITDNPTRYVKVFLKNMWHVIDLGIYNSSERRRNAEKVKSLYEKIRDFLIEIFNTIWNFFAGRVEAAQRGAQQGWAAYERKKEGDPREWTEEDALKRLREIKTKYKTMDKDELTKDIISLCMQPLYKVQTYEEIVHFLEKLNGEKIIEQASLDRAFDYVNYKGKFAREHEIGEVKTSDDKHDEEKPTAKLEEKPIIKHEEKPAAEHKDASAGAKS